MTANLKLSNLLGFCELFSISVEELVRGNSAKDESKARQEKEVVSAACPWKAYRDADAATQAAVDLLLLPNGQLTGEAQAITLLMKSIAAQEMNQPVRAFQIA